MTLSIHKLIKLLMSRGFYPKTFFRIYNVCAFIEIISNKNAEAYMIYIPSRYNFSISSTEMPNVYDLKEITLDEDKNIVKSYGDEPDELAIEENYQNINIPNPNLFKDDKNLEEFLQKKYNKTIALSEPENADNSDLKCLYRQMERLKFCVQNVEYRLVILYKCYLCFQHTESDIDLYHIRGFPSRLERTLCVTLDLELLYNNNTSVDSDLDQISRGIEKILDKNYSLHIQNLQTLIETKENVITSVKIAISKKHVNSKYIYSFLKLFQTIYNDEKILEKQMSEIKKGGEGSLYNDIEFSHARHRLAKELAKIQKVKHELLKNITQLKGQNSNISLMMDKILFDNIILLDKIFKNLELLKQLR